ncbi:glycosyltransferase [Cyanobium gracile UHCC 0139]|uniref:Glycosyltransferase n=1 Tax=Cyanobium gracile UHCC 0139 TaxID=3110308 RepID=A0ABU5RRT5_9CYAN|nr:glycosyltransferase [Cyanobium gracile]MEA5390456.1 glycosyltransferase [Cyanobium gracile UHCC 0139]
MSDNVRISVLLPVRDAEAHLVAALESLIHQSERRIEIIAIDDGSRDATPRLLAGMADRDPRLTVVRQPRDGLVAALNRGLALARAPLVARMDGDDIAHPQRLERQAAFLAAHPDVAVVGSAIRVVDRRGQWLRDQAYPTEPAAVARALQVANCLAHPSVMLRREAVLAAGGYRGAFVMAEDFDLWLRLSEHHSLANLPTPLLDYRDHPAQASWCHIEQRILSELAALACARERRAGRPDPAPRTVVSSDHLRAMGMDGPSVARETALRAIGAVREAMASGHREAGAAALQLCWRQRGLPWRLGLRRLEVTGRFRCWTQRGSSP